MNRAANIVTPSYVIVTPARDEEENIGAAIACVVAQTIRPSAWVIVDDGSTDRTAAVVGECAKGYPWIKLVSLGATGDRRPGSKIVDAFKHGERFLPADYDFIVKLDADVTMGSDYFERLLARFMEEAGLGIAGGYCGACIGGETVLDETPPYHVRGATKIYRRECYSQIGGLISAMGWDTLDEMKAMMLGWKTRSFRDVVLLHHRLTGSATGLLRYAWMAGKSFWFMGYDPLYLLLSSLKRAFKKPILLFSLTIILGYLTAFLTNDPVIEDKDLIGFIRKFQRNRLTGRGPDQRASQIPVHAEQRR